MYTKRQPTNLIHTRLLAYIEENPSLKDNTKTKAILNWTQSLDYSYECDEAWYTSDTTPSIFKELSDLTGTSKIYWINLYIITRLYLNKNVH